MRTLLKGTGKHAFYRLIIARVRLQRRHGDPFSLKAQRKRSPCPIKRGTLKPSMLLATETLTRLRSSRRDLSDRAQAAPSKRTRAAQRRRVEVACDQAPDRHLQEGKPQLTTPLSEISEGECHSKASATCMPTCWNKGAIYLYICVWRQTDRWMESDITTLN